MANVYGLKIVHRALWIAAYSYDTSTWWADNQQQNIPPTPERVTMTISSHADREMLTAEEVHDMTGIPVSTLHDWAAKRERGVDAPGPYHIRLSDRHRRWARRDVNQWIESARV